MLADIYTDDYQVNLEQCCKKEESMGESWRGNRGVAAKNGC